MKIRSGTRVVLCGRTDMTKLIIVVFDFVKAPKHSINVPQKIAVLLSDVVTQL